MKTNDFITVDFTGTLPTGETFDTTTEGHHAHPALVVLGKKMVLPAVEKQLEAMTVGEEKTFTVPPEDGFGMRKPELIKIVSLAKFHEKNISPVPGMVVDIDGLPVKVTAVSGGRVRLDFNHPLAGKELTYRIKIVSLLEKLADKAAAIVSYLHLHQATTEMVEGKVTICADKKLEPQLQELVKRTFADLLPEASEPAFVVKADQRNKPG